MSALGQGSTFLFEGFHFDRHGLFRRSEPGILAPVAIGGRALDLLGVLVERYGEVISKPEIMAAVWPKAVVEEGNLTLQISALRRILDRGRSGTSCIQTVARRGYRFVAAVTRVEAEASDVAAAISPDGASSLPRLSIMVLPFTNHCNDPEHEYFADEITRDLTTDLSRISGSFVIACSTAFAYKGKAVDVKRVGRELGVRYVLEGSVRCSGSQVRMNAQLVDAQTGGHLWAERFETDRGSLAEAEDEIIGRLAWTLKLKLVEDVNRRSKQERAIDPDPHDLALRGWALFYRPRSVTTLQEAREAFEHALKRQPQSIDARIGLATVLVTALLEGWSSSAQPDRARAEQLLTEVFARGVNDSMAHHAMGLLRRSQNRLKEARIEAESAVALDRHNSAALYQLGLAFLYLGHPEVAVPQVEKAIRLSPRDPLVSAMHYGLGRCHLLLGHLEQATELFERVRAASPEDCDVRLWLAGTLGLKGDLEGASAELAEARRLKPEIDSLAPWGTYKPWFTNPEYRALREKTLNLGLRRIGFPNE
jgi:adenylate cyclase